MHIPLPFLAYSVWKTCSSELGREGREEWCIYFEKAPQVSWWFSCSVIFSSSFFTVPLLCGCIAITFLSPALQIWGGIVSFSPHSSSDCFHIFSIPLPFLLYLLSQLIILQNSSLFLNSHGISEIKFMLTILHCKIRVWRRRKELTFIKHFSARQYARCSEDINSINHFSSGSRLDYFSEMFTPCPSLSWEV